MKTKILLIMATILFLDMGVSKATHYLVEDGDYIDGIDLINNDTLLMTGGEIDGLNAYNTSIATILDTIPIEPMDAGIRWLYAYDSSTINFSGGSVWNFEGFDSSTINIDGGIIRYLIMNESSVSHLSGGQIDSAMGIRDDTSFAHIYGYDFDYDPSGGSYGEGLVTGFWPDSEPISLSLNNLHPSEVITYDQLVFHVIPEPCSMSLLLAGGIALLKKC